MRPLRTALLAALLPLGLQGQAPDSVTFRLGWAEPPLPAGSTPVEALAWSLWRSDNDVVNPDGTQDTEIAAGQVPGAAREVSIPVPLECPGDATEAFYQGFVEPQGSWDSPATRQASAEVVRVVCPEPPNDPPGPFAVWLDTLGITPPDTTTVPPEPPDTTTTPPDPPEPGVLPPRTEGWIFFDSLPEAGKGPEQNGVFWGATNGTLNYPLPGSTGDQNGFMRGNGDCCSIRFRYPAGGPSDDAFAEQRMRIPSLPEFWIEWDSYISEDYCHRSGAAVSGPVNNKFFGTYQGPRSGNPGMILETNPTGDCGSRLRTYDSFGSVTFTPAWGGPVVISEAGPHTLGSWNRMGWHVRCASGPGMNDGLVELYVNGQLVDRSSHDAWPTDGSDCGFTEVELWGWANSGFDEQADIWMDNASVGAGDPGWN